MIETSVLQRILNYSEALSDETMVNDVVTLIETFVLRLLF